MRFQGSKVPFKIWFSVMVLAVFTAGFAIHMYRNAGIAGSWKYVINSADDYLYWSYAKGAASEPASDGNPYYFEEIGKSHTIPYTTSMLIGWLSQLLDVHVLVFYPVWHILIPFVVWLSLWLSLVHYWKYPERKAAVFSLVILLLSLFLRNVSHQSIYRFSRPGDALWMLIIWISFAKNAFQTGRVGKTIGTVAAMLVIWFNPFYAAMGLLIHVFAFLWHWKMDKGQSTAKLLLLSLMFVIVSCGAYAGYILLNMSENPWVFKQFGMEVSGAKEAGNPILNLSRIDWVTISLFVLSVLSVVVSKKLTHRSITVHDRLLILVFLNRFIFTNIPVVLPGEFQIAQHTFYFTLFEVLTLIGWFFEKMNIWKDYGGWRKVERAVVAVAAAMSIVILLNEKFTFLLFNLDPWHRNADFGMTNDTVFLYGMIPVIFVLVWFYARVDKLRHFLTQFSVLAAVISFLTVTAYWHYPTRYAYAFQDFPFDGAYQWLNQYGKPNEVVLTVPQDRQRIDYLILYTDLKTYLHPAGDFLAHSRLNEDNVVRFLFYLNLVMGGLEEADIAGLKTMEEKINRLRLNYILLERDTPFLFNVVGQLKPYMDEVYSDSDSVLFRINNSVLTEKNRF